MNVPPVVDTQLATLELPVEKLLRRAHPLPPREEMLIDDLGETQGEAFPAALER
jgi:hypothetical protein